ncbi:MAG TPA: VCBS repeat-containing protein [Anaerolineales bacterium]
MDENTSNLTVQLILAIAGCIALLIGLFGGGVKAKEIEVPKISASARIFSILVGAVLIGIAIRLPNPPQTPEPPTATSIPATEPQSPQITATLPAPGDAPTDVFTKTPTKFPMDTPSPTTEITPTEEPFKQFTPPGKWSDFFCQTNEDCLAADVNADGKADLIAFVRNTQAGSGYADVWVSLSYGNGIEAASKWSDFFCQTDEVCTAADVNGDGQADLIAFVRNTQSETGYADVWVSVSNGTGFETPSKWSDFFCQTNEVCTAADVNGDGKADLIAFVRDTQSEPSRHDVWVGLSTGTAFESPTKWNDFFCLENELCTAADVNGDGTADLIAFVRDTQWEPGRYDVYVGLSTGTAFARAIKWSDFFCKESELCTAADVDGDGKADLIVFVLDTQSEPDRYDVYVGLSTGTAFTRADKWSDFFCKESELCTTADINGDHKADLIAFVRDTQLEPGYADVWVSLEVK